MGIFQDIYCSIYNKPKPRNKVLTPWQTFLHVLFNNGGYIYGEIVGLCLDVPIDDKVLKKEINIGFHTSQPPTIFANVLKLKLKEMPLPYELDIQGGWQNSILYYAAKYRGVKLNIICYSYNIYQAKGVDVIFRGWGREDITLDGEATRVYTYPWSFGSKQSINFPPYRVLKYKKEFDLVMFKSLWKQITGQKT